MQRKPLRKARRARTPALGAAALGAAALGLAALTAGCGAPYVHIDGEFNRSRAGFGRAPQTIENVTVCYSALDTGAGAVTEMAEARCAEFGKTAVFESKTVTVCPAFTPNAAKFICVKKDASAGGMSRRPPEEG